MCNHCSAHNMDIAASEDAFFDVAGANVGGSEVRRAKAIIRKDLLDKIVVAARASADLSPFLESTHLADDSLTEPLWRLPNPVIEALAELDAWDKEHGE